MDGAWCGPGLVPCGCVRLGSFGQRPTKRGNPRFRSPRLLQRCQGKGRGLACALNGEVVVESDVAARVDVHGRLEALADELLLAVQHADAKVRVLLVVQVRVVKITLRDFSRCFGSSPFVSRTQLKRMYFEIATHQNVLVVLSLSIDSTAQPKHCQWKNR